jgi:hypothetical protein
MTDPYNCRYCKDCKWFSEGWNVDTHSTDWNCFQPSGVYGPIHGFSDYVPQSAYEMRTTPACGPEGKLWEPKDEND